MPSTRIEQRRWRRHAGGAAGPAVTGGRRSRRALALAALTVFGGLIAVTQAPLPGRAPETEAASATLARYAGIPQDGSALGDPSAPLTVVEFVDLQCPACATFDRTTLAAVIDGYVRPRDVRLELRTLAFLGADSVRAAQAAEAAASQDRLWQFAHRFFALQRAENSGYVSDEFLRDVSRGIPGLDADRVVASMDGAGIARAERDARNAGVASTPSLLVGRTGGRLDAVAPEALDAASFTRLLDRRLGRRRAR